MVTAHAVERRIVQVVYGTKDIEVVDLLALVEPEARVT